MYDNNGMTGYRNIARAKKYKVDVSFSSKQSHIIPKNCLSMREEYKRYLPAAVIVFDGE